jgi:hypothetical protein
VERVKAVGIAVVEEMTVALENVVAWGRFGYNRVIAVLDTKVAVGTIVAGV